MWLGAGTAGEGTGERKEFGRLFGLCAHPLIFYSPERSGG